jgi:hypothetical protein
MNFPQTLKLVARRYDPANPNHSNGARGGPLVPDYEALTGSPSVKRFIGMRLDPTKGTPIEYKDFVKKGGGKLVEETVYARQAVFVPLEGPEAIVEKPYRHEYIAALTSAELLPGDPETARVAGVLFDPTFKFAMAEKVG